MPKIKTLILVVLVAAVSPFAFLGWKDLVASGFVAKASSFLERTPPQIIISQDLVKIGLNGAKLSIKAADFGAGIDEMVVRVSQRGVTKLELRKKIDSKAPTFEVTFPPIEFPGNKTIVDEGSAKLDVRVFDRSFWSNTSEKTIPLLIDYHMPRVEVVSKQHNARLGGSQLLFYRAADDDLDISGVYVGERVFLGFPARGIDRELEDPNLFAVFYAVDLESTAKPEDVRVFAQDRVGNSVEKVVYNKIQSRSDSLIKVPIGYEFVRSHIVPLIEQNKNGIEGNFSKPDSAKIFPLPPLTESVEDVRRVVELVVTKLRELDRINLIDFLQDQNRGSTRFEKLWDDLFLRPGGPILTSFGDEIHFMYEKEEVGVFNSRGYEMGVQRNSPEIIAASAGVVSQVETFGTFGRLVVIDHGLGISTVYGRLDKVTVKKGEQVKAGTVIGMGGTTGIARTPEVYFEVRVQGVEVDPREWWDRVWYYSHITSKIAEVKDLFNSGTLSAL